MCVCVCVFISKGEKRKHLVLGAGRKPVFMEHGEEARRAFRPWQCDKLHINWAKRKFTRQFSVKMSHHLNVKIGATKMGFPGGTSGKEPTHQCRRLKDTGLTPGLGRSLGGGHGNPLQYSCLEYPMGRGAWWATVHGVTKSQTKPKRISTHTYH